MKFCTSCGAALMDGAASFCSNCGKPVARPPGIEMPAQSAPAQIQPAPTSPTEGAGLRIYRAGQSEETAPSAPVKNPPRHAAKKKSPKKQKRTPKPKQAPPSEEAGTVLDDGYDGYYDDVPTEDDGHIKEGVDKETVKRIIMVAAGALIIVGLSILVMYVL